MQTNLDRVIPFTQGEGLTFGADAGVKSAGLKKIGGSSVMQRTGPIGGPGHLGLQGPPRSLKISSAKIQDESGDPISQSTYPLSLFLFLH